MIIATFDGGPLDGRQLELPATADQLIFQATCGHPECSMGQYKLQYHLSFPSRDDAGAYRYRYQDSP